MSSNGWCWTCFIRRGRGSGPSEIYATLLDEGVYHYSIRSMYRLLGEHGKFANGVGSCVIIPFTPRIADRNPNEV